MKFIGILSKAKSDRVKSDAAHKQAQKNNDINSTISYKLIVTPSYKKNI